MLVPTLMDPETLLIKDLKKYALVKNYMLKSSFTLFMKSCIFSIYVLFLVFF